MSISIGDKKLKNIAFGEHFLVRYIFNNEKFFNYKNIESYEELKQNLIFNENVLNVKQQMWENLFNNITYSAEIDCKRGAVVKTKYACDKINCMFTKGVILFKQYDNGLTLAKCVLNPTDKGQDITVFIGENNNIAHILQLVGTLKTFEIICDNKSTYIKLTSTDSNNQTTVLATGRIEYKKPVYAEIQVNKDEYLIIGNCNKCEDLQQINY